MGIEYDPDFEPELKRAVGFVKQVSPAAAARLKELIEKAILRIAKRPHGGRQRGIRHRSVEIPGHPYRILYHVRPNHESIVILALEDTRRRAEDLSERQPF